MQPHEQRVVDEKTELDDKLAKLNAFIGQSPIFQGLPTEDQALLKAQHTHMTCYTEVLGQRIERFNH